ncbi:MAG: GAF domain-containing sensor histidine kinase [Candidatus Eisenbacteria bacterium]
MSPRPISQEWRRVDRAGWLLWLATFALLLALTAAVPTLYYPLATLGSEDGMPHPLPREAWASIVGLVGLVLLFCLYTVTKQREVELMRRALEQEERERDASRARMSELLALFEVSTSLQLQLRLDTILEILVRRVVATFKAQQASVMIVDVETGDLVTRASYGLESEFSRGARRRPGEGIAGWVAHRREALLLGAKAPSDEFARWYKDNRTISSALSMPLVIGERVIGVLNVNRINHPDAFGPEHVELLRVFGEHLAAVIDRAETMERLGLRAHQLELDNEKLADLNQMKDVFLSTASHELKTPLSSVIAYAELLDDHDGKLTREQSREFVGRLRSEAHRLLGLIDDILDLSRLESGKMQLKQRPVALDEVVRGGIETTRALAKKYEVTVEEDFASGLPVIVMDEVKIRQVAVNLLVNAVKFSPRGASVRVSTRLDGRFVRLEVRDDGPGVPPEAATHLFELFAQGAGDEPQSRGGLGIGLHLVKRLTELHGGHVGVNSRPGSGSTFWVRLPIAPECERPADAEPGERRAA